MKQIKEEDCRIPIAKYENMTISECLLLSGIIDLIKTWKNESALNEDGINDSLMENERYIYIKHIADLRNILEAVEEFYKL